MSINFVKKSSDEDRNEKRKTLERKLEQAKNEYEVVKRKRQLEDQRGDSKWILPSLEKRMDENDHLKKKHKKKHKKHKKKEEDEEWEEADQTDETVDKTGDTVDHANKTFDAKYSCAQSNLVNSASSQIQSFPKREEWMLTSSLLEKAMTSSSDRENKTKTSKIESRKKEEEERMCAYSSRELNPYWKDGGAGLPLEAKKNQEKGNVEVGDGGKSWIQKAYERSKLQAKEEGIPIEDIVARRWGSMAKLNALLKASENSSRHKQESKHVSSSGWRKSKDQSNQSRSLQASNNLSTSMKTYSSKEDKSCENKTPLDNYSEASAKKSSDDHIIAKDTDKLSSKSDSPEPISPIRIPLTDKEKNEVSAKILRAELMGNTALCAQLKLELQQGRPISIVNTEKVLSSTEEVLLTREDKHGNLYPLKLQHSSAKLKDELGVVLKKNYVPRQSGNIPFYMEPGHLLNNIANRRNIALSKLHASPLLLGSDQLRCEQWIKKGVFGDVMKYIKKDENKSLVLKRFTDISAEHVNVVAQSLMCLHDHKHIVQFVGLSLLDNGLMLAFEYLELGNLESYLPKLRDSLKYGLLLKFLRQLGDAVMFLHSKDLVHGDLQLKNIYLSDFQTIKLSDSCVMWKLSEDIEKPYVKNNCSHYAPEIFLNDKPLFTKETDIWALALTIWQLFTLEKPFKTMTYFEMKNFFHEHLNKNSTYASSLAYMNLESPCYCPTKLCDLFNNMLCLAPNKRKNVAEICAIIADLLKSPTREKEKNYFTFDWKVLQVDLDWKGNENSMVDSGISDSRNYQKIDANMVYGIHQEENMEVEKVDYSPVEQISSIDNKHNKAFSSINNSSLIMQNSKLKLLIKDKHSRSAPCSPTQNKFVNLYSLDDCDKVPEANFSKDLNISMIIDQKTTDHKDVSTYEESFYRTSFLPNKSCKNQEQFENFSSEKPSYCIDDNKQSESDIDIKTASILLDLSQANSSTPYVELKGNSYIQQTKPYIQTFNSTVSTREDYAPKLDNLASVAKADSTKISPPPTPPDSPEQIRRDNSDQPKREWFRNPKTRQYLQERINFERERFYGKRSMSFQEESNEYTENTKKIAKMALLGPNPFNISINLPHRFFGKKDVPLNPQPFSCELSRFIKNEFEDPVKHDDTDFSNPYKSLQDLELIRKCKFTNSKNGPNKTQSEIQSVVKDFKDLQASSPNPFITHLSTTHAAVISTINVFTNNPGIASVGITSTIQSNMQGGKPIISSSTNRSYGSHSEGKRQSRRNKDHAPKTDIYSVGAQVPVSISENAFPTLKQQNIQPRLLGVNTRFPTSATQSSLHCTIAPVSRTIYIHPVNSTQEPIQLFPRAHFNGSPVTSIQSFQVLNPHFINGSPIITQPTLKKTDLTMPPRLSLDPTIPSRPSSDHFSPSLGNEDPYKKTFTFSEEHLPSMFRFIERKDLKIEESLGQGQFGEVFKGLWLFTDKNKIKLNVPVAIKKLLQRDTTCNIKDIQDFRREAITMAALSRREISDSQYIVKLHGVCAEGLDTDFSIVTEYLSLGSLDQFIPLKKKELNSGYLLLYCKQIAHGVDYLHTQNILHRDLACRNVLVADKELVKLSDFGLSRFLFNKSYHDNEKFQKLPVQWLSLESIEQCIYTQKTDIWTYGVVLWEMFTLLLTEIKDLPVIPYKDISLIDLPAYLRSGERLTKPDCFPVELWNLTVKCWNLLEDERPSFYAFKEFIGNLLESAPIKSFFWA